MAATKQGGPPDGIMKAEANPEGRCRSPKAHANHYSAGRAMNDFLTQSVHQAEITGTLSMFDRIIFKGHLTRLFPKGALALFLSPMGSALGRFH